MRSDARVSYLGLMDGETWRLELEPLQDSGRVLGEAVSLIHGVFQVAENSSEFEVLLAGGFPVGHTLQSATDLDFAGLAAYSPARTQFSTAQLIWLPHALGRPDLEELLPQRFSGMSWTGMKHLGERDFRLELHSQGWRAVYILDDSYWPREITVECALPVCPYASGALRRIDLVEGTEFWSSVDELPVWSSTWEVGQTVVPVPELTLGPLVPSLGSTVQYAEAHSAAIAEFMQNHPGWRVQRAVFEGSDRTGETSWYVQLEPGDGGSGLQFTLGAPLGNVNLATGTGELDVQPGPSTTVPAHPQDSQVRLPLVPTWLQEQLDCRTDALGIQTTVVTYRLGDRTTTATSPLDGTISFNVRGISPVDDCTRRAASWTAGLATPGLLLFQKRLDPF